MTLKTPILRISYMTFVGPIPEGMHVLHKCDNPCCINPLHLYAGTNEQNVRDWLERGPYCGHRGSDNCKAKLTEKDIPIIRAMDKPTREIAEQYGVSISAITHIKNGRTWKHVD